MKRKEFIKQSLYVGVGAVCIPQLIQSCAAYKPKFVEEGNYLKIKKSEFLDTTKNPPVSRIFISVKLERYEFPIGISELPNGTYSAVYLRCTHRGCGLQNTGEDLQCPCHGSEFSYSGKVLSAPADENLSTFKVEEKGEELWITLT